MFVWSRLILRSLCLVALTASHALADDGGIAVGGSPGLLKDHRSVSMAGEVIRITVQRNKLTADCRFVFKNSGPDCTVRMGFPDAGQGLGDPDHGKDPKAVMHTPPHTTFQSFRSWVDGRPIHTDLIRAAAEGEYWHAKTVRFPAHSTLLVRDLYTQAIDGRYIKRSEGTCFAAEIGYILETGASWHGPIGHVDIKVTFVDPALPGRLKFAPDTDAKTGMLWRFNTVSWHGPCTPYASAHALRFICTNLRPHRGDNIDLWYAYRDYTHKAEDE